MGSLCSTNKRCGYIAAGTEEIERKIIKVMKTIKKQKVFLYLKLDSNAEIHKTSEGQGNDKRGCERE